MKEAGDDYWYPCSVHLCQLASKEAVTLYINGHASTTLQGRECEWNEWSSEEALEIFQTHHLVLHSKELLSLAEPNAQPLSNLIVIHSSLSIFNKSVV